MRHAASAGFRLCGADTLAAAFDVSFVSGVQAKYSGVDEMCDTVPALTLPTSELARGLP